MVLNLSSVRASIYRRLLKNNQEKLPKHAMAYRKSERKSLSLRTPSGPETNLRSNKGAEKQNNVPQQIERISASYDSTLTN